MGLVVDFLITASLSFLVTFFLVPIFCSLAQRLQFVDIPDGKIKVHKGVVPYLGGVALYCGFLLGIALVIPFENQILLFLIGATFLLFVGLVDDFFVLKPHQKFFGQIVATCCFLKAGLYLKEEFFLNNIWSVPVSFVWILSITNAFNLVDVMDGLATILAICVTISFASIALFFGLTSVVIMLGALFGGLCGFFWYNRPPAKIYLGDAGALFIGGVLATVPFLFRWSLCNEYGYFSPVIILAIPIIEVVSLIIIRVFKGIPIYQGSSDHFSLYLLSHGWSKTGILMYIMIISFALWIVALLFFFNKISMLYTAVILSLFLLLWMLILCVLKFN